MKQVFLSLLYLFVGTVLSLGQAADGKIKNEELEILNKINDFLNSIAVALTASTQKSPDGTVYLLSLIHI